MKFKKIFESKIGYNSVVKKRKEKYDKIYKDEKLTPQQKIKKILEDQSIPYEKIDVYGNQIVIDTYSEESAHEWIMFLQRHKFKIKKIIHGKKELKNKYTDEKGRYKKYTIEDRYTIFATI